MNLEVQEKKFSFKRFLASMRHSIDGIISAYKNEQSLWIHGVCSIIAIIISVWLKLNFYEWAWILRSLMIVLAVELLNTGIEATIDLVTKEYHPLAKIAKDSGAAASFVVAIATIIICLYIFMPKIIEVVGK